MSQRNVPWPAEALAALIALCAAPWAIAERSLPALTALLRNALAGGAPSSVAATEAAAPARAAGVPARGGVAILSIAGMITPRASVWSDYFGDATIDSLIGRLRAAVTDSSVSAIVLDINSPGGSVYAVDELADEIMRLKAQKPIVAIANPLAASAAYWIGSAASAFLLTPSGEAGSVGVFMVHLDWSKALADAGIAPTIIQAGKHKTDGNPYEPLSDDARAHFQASVDRYYDMFVRGVAKGRQVPVATVRRDFGEGRVFGAKDALAAGMVDAIGTLDDAIAKAAALARRPAGEPRATDAGPAPQASELAGDAEHVLAPAAGLAPTSDAVADTAHDDADEIACHLAALALASEQ